MTYYRILLPALVRAGCSVKVIEGSAFTASASSNPAVIDGVSVETLEFSRLKMWESRIPGLEALPGFKRSVAASWAMWEAGGLGEGVDLIEAVDFGLGFI